MVNRLISVMVFVLCGCSDSLSQNCLQLGRPTVGEMAILGEETTLEVFLPRGVCGIDPTTIRVNLELVRPDNSRVEPQRVTLDGYNDYTGLTGAMVTFTPDVRGAWQIITEFEPNLGRAQVEIIVVEPRDTPRFSVDLPFDPRRCENQPWRTTAGAVLCEVDGRVHLFRERMVDESFAGSDLSVVGNTVWFSNGSTLTRATDTGGTTLRLDAQAPMPSSRSSDWSHFTNEDTTFRSYDTRISRFDFLDGGLWERSFEQPGFAFLTGAEAWRFDAPMLCPLPTEGDAGCRNLGGSPVAVDGDDLWVSTGRAELNLAPLTSRHVLAHSMPSGSALVSIGRSMVTQQKFGFTSNGISVVALREGNELRLVTYGAGEVLGTRGDFAVLHVEGTNTVAFARFHSGP